MHSLPCINSYISTVPAEPNILPSSPVLGACPVGWNSFNLKCYYNSDKKNNWVNSQRDCRQRGAELVVIDSNEEQVRERKCQIISKENFIRLHPLLK
uniref:C-type lectin domain-containing protein n=1 Tax=Paramormyrops kingsleyae TaxID=1676925 RepID=A0A3B3SCX5_9TELE